jgi:hypothetical protein
MLISRFSGGYQAPIVSPAASQVFRRRSKDAEQEYEILKEATFWTVLSQPSQEQAAVVS